MEKENEKRCEKDAGYNVPGESKRLYCRLHKLEGMVAVKRKDSRSCIKCGKRACFDKPGAKKARFCVSCKDSDMVNVYCRKCVVCKRCQPTYGKLTDGKKRGVATHCSKCKEMGMVDCVSNLCTHVDCYKNAVFGLVGDKKASRCRLHATPRMIDIKNERCIVCVQMEAKRPKQPTFGTLGGKPTHCKAHKKKEMVDLRHDTLICKHPGCGIRATYGESKGQPLYCKIHKPGDKCLSDVISKMCERCNQHQPVFNYPGNKEGIRCAACKMRGMVDVENPRCVSCNSFMVSKRGKMCNYCNPRSYRWKKIKEMEVYNYLKNECKLSFEYNKSIGIEYGGLRPDFKIYAGTHLVIVEVDEYQHKEYYEINEVSRMFNIHRAARGLKCVFLRYNPDGFMVNGKSRRVSQEKRLSMLRDEIKKHMHTVPDDDLSVYRMFYDTEEGGLVQRYPIGERGLKLMC